MNMANSDIFRDQGSNINFWNQKGYIIESSVDVGELESVCLLQGIHVQMFHKHCAEQMKIFWGWIWAKCH